ncbi:diguanylate cyclase [Clostridium estertheticum]|uniref:diguanylate cyclase n=1 Tax=Clostridium estertheticum TaxID=238834 RepID=UPI001C6F574D|nr:diguanylate cyclase [Clostridium estertheticum]MBW9153454.1 diguanylate cyclase [Clostridium estertheticum]WLC84140.1 diguanylate cyclase [Clostridium estertheticum]
MEIINNRYRIVKSIKQNRLVSSYIVNDIRKNYDTVQLNILNSDYLKKELIEFYTKEFISLTNLKCGNVTLVYDFDLINLLDNKKLDDKVYFFTNEYVKNDFSILDVVSNMQSDELLDLFIEICQSINYLHLKGFVYSDINLSNIIVTNTKYKRNCVKFKDFATVELEKQTFWKDENNEEYFKAPEILKGKKCSIFSDIYSLGILLFIIYMKSENCNFVINDEINDIKIKETFNNNRNLNINFQMIIEKMIYSDITKRYQNISELVIDINNLFEKRYLSYRKKEINKLNTNLKMIGRGDEVYKIINSYECIKNEGENNLTVFIHGESGIGKTRFLKSLKYLFSLRKVNVYNSFTLEASTKNSNVAFVDILKQLISECESEILERYESELVKLIPELGSKKNIIHSKPLSGDKEKYRLIHFAAGFIEECIGNKPIVIIIDNFHLADEFTIELIEYITRKKLQNKKIMIIMSYCDGECVLNKKFIKFKQTISRSVVATNIFLKELSEIEVGKMIENILSMPNIPYKFAESIFEKTKGNPLFVQEIIKSFFNKNSIYIDKEKGCWTIDYDYSKFNVPEDMHPILLNQVKEMGKLNFNILKIISIFKSAVSLEVIKGFINKNSEELGIVIKGLISSGILCKKIEDRGFVFDFYNKFLKSLMYERISDGDKKNMHRLASVLLEGFYAQGGKEYIEELIYHLEKSDQRQKIIEYCIENARKMKLLKNRSDAIKNLTKAVSIINCLNNPVENIKLIMDLADLHEQEGHNSIAIKYYLSLQMYNDNTQLHNYTIDSLIKIAMVYLNKNDIKSVIYYIKKINTMLEKTDYRSGWLKCQGIQASVYEIRQEYENVETICNSGIEMCKGEYEGLKSIFYNHKGIVLMRIGRAQESLIFFKKAITICNKYNNTDELIKALDYIGVIYEYYYQDNNMATKYFLKTKKVCEKNNMSNREVDASINIAVTYFLVEKYEISLQYFIEQLGKCRKYEFELKLFYCYSSIAIIYLRLDDYDNAYKYYELCNKEITNHPDQRENIEIFYFLAAEINYKLGDMQKAESYINKVLVLYGNNQSILALWAQILNKCIKIYLRKNDDDLINDITNIVIIANKVLYVSSRLNIFYGVVILLYDNEIQEYASIIFNEINKINIDIDVKDHRVYVKKLYVDGLIENKNSIEFFNEALEYSKKYKEIDICWKIYTAIGDYYFNKEDYLYAVIYYFEACGILRNINLKLPIKYRLSYIRLNNAIRPFNRFLGINNYYKNNKDTSMLKFEQASISDEEGLMDVLEQVNHKDILKNENFIKSIKKIYSVSLHEGIHDIGDVLENLQADNLRNLELIIDYLSYITLATRGIIIIKDDDNKEYKVIASSDRKYELPQSPEKLSEILSQDKAELVTDCYQNQDATGDKNNIYNTIKASICIPIIMEDITEKSIVKNERRKSIQGSKYIIGHIYIESQRVLNNLNNASMKKCTELSKVIGIIIEKYKLRLSSSVDKLTGTLTRKYLEEALDEQIEKSSLDESKFSLIMYDLDCFKIINDKFGHRTGDYALKRVCDVVLRNLRDTDIVGRYGGEEFIVILPDTDIYEAQLVAEKLRSKIEQEKILDNRRDVTVSLGVITCPMQGEWQGELVERVDQALYVAKQQGRNRYVTWNSDFSKKAKKTDRLAGIISGNELQDHRNVLAMIELIELININLTKEDKIYSLLGRIIEITEAQKCILFLVENGDITERYSREIFINEWVDSDTYNKSIIKSVLDSKQGVWKIDWDTIIEYDVVTGAPNWQSVIVIPLIKDDYVKGVLYLSESTQVKEFSFDDFNFVSMLGKIIVPIL